jgi:hypothetical protein
MSRNVLVVSTVEQPEPALRRLLGDDVERLEVIVPVVRQGFLDWLANDEQAAAAAERAAAHLADELPRVSEARKGEADVLLAIEDALATFDADEVVVALHPEDEAPFAERVAQDDVRPSVHGVPVRAVVIRDGR